jgi:hypothetical protein
MCKNLRAHKARIPIVDGPFPAFPPEQARGWLGPQGGTLIAATSGWIPMMFMTLVIAIWQAPGRSRTCSHMALAFPRSFAV